MRSHGSDRADFALGPLRAGRSGLTLRTGLALRTNGAYGAGITSRAFGAGGADFALGPLRAGRASFALGTDLALRTNGAYRAGFTLRTYRTDRTLRADRTDRPWLTLWAGRNVCDLRLEAQILLIKMIEIRVDLFGVCGRAV